MTDTAIALLAAVRANGFGVVRVQDIKVTTTTKGMEFAHECLIFEVCQPQQPKTVLDRRMKTSTTVSCRISIYEEGGKTKVATMKPSTLYAMFKAPRLEDVVQVMKEAAACRLAGHLKFPGEDDVRASRVASRPFENQKQTTN